MMNSVDVFLESRKVLFSFKSGELLISFLVSRIDFVSESLYRP